MRRLLTATAAALALSAAARAEQTHYAPPSPGVPDVDATTHLPTWVDSRAQSSLWRQVEFTGADGKKHQLWCVATKCDPKANKNANHVDLFVFGPPKTDHYTTLAFAWPPYASREILVYDTQLSHYALDLTQTPPRAVAAGSAPAAATLRDPPAAMFDVHPPTRLAGDQPAPAAPVAPKPRPKPAAPQTPAPTDAATPADQTPADQNPATTDAATPADQTPADQNSATTDAATPPEDPNSMTLDKFRGLSPDQKKAYCNAAMKSAAVGTPAPDCADSLAATDQGVQGCNQLPVDQRSACLAKVSSCQPASQTPAAPAAPTLAPELRKACQDFLAGAGLPPDQNLAGTTTPTLKDGSDPPAPPADDGDGFLGNWSKHTAAGLTMGMTGLVVASLMASPAVAVGVGVLAAIGGFGLSWYLNKK